MRRLTATEFGMLVLAAVFFIVGGDSIWHPTEMTVFHQAYRVRSSMEHISKDGSQIYGGLMILLGVGLVWMVFYGRRK